MSTTEMAACFTPRSTLLNSIPCAKSSKSISLKSNVGNRRMVVRAETVEVETDNSTLTGVIFEPFTEVQTQLTQVSQVSASTTQSYARQRFSAASEAAINEQINVEYNMSYLYHSLYAYFDRDYVGLKGFAQYYKKASAEEREHAEKLMEYQNKRGGKVKLQSILSPSVTEFDHPEKGDALYAMELTLALEKLTNEKLLHLHSVASQENDAQLSDFIESEFLADQVDDIKRVSEYVAQLRRVGKGHGVWDFDLKLQEQA